MYFNPNWGRIQYKFIINTIFVHVFACSYTHVFRTTWMYESLKRQGLMYHVSQVQNLIYRSCWQYPEGGDCYRKNLKGKVVVLRNEHIVDCQYSSVVNLVFDNHFCTGINCVAVQSLISGYELIHVRRYIKTHGFINFRMYKIEIQKIWAWNCCYHT